MLTHAITHTRTHTCTHRDPHGEKTPLAVRPRASDPEATALSTGRTIQVDIQERQAVVRVGNREQRQRVVYDELRGSKREAALVDKHKHAPAVRHEGHIQPGRWEPQGATRSHHVIKCTCAHTVTGEGAGNGLYFRQPPVHLCRGHTFRLSWCGVAPFKTPMSNETRTNRHNAITP
jgi:hypothetical protein